MFMLYESVAWACLLLSFGYASTSRWNSVSSTLFFVGVILINKINQKKIKVYIAASLDGYIARPDGGLDWLTEFPNPSGSDHGYNDLLTSVDTVIMGGRTYREILCMDVLWPYKEQKTYVVSRNMMQTNEDIEFITESITEEIAKLKSQQGKDIWLVGGGELITMLLNADLVDELQICYIPVILGEGIPLFTDKPKESNWELTGNTAYDSGIILLSFTKANIK